MRTTAVGAGLVAVANACRIWSNLDCATSDLLVARTAAISLAAGTGQTNKIIVFEIDPADLGDTYDCAAVQATTGPPVTSALAILYFGVPRYKSRVLTQPSIIID